MESGLVASAAQYINMGKHGVSCAIDAHSVVFSAPPDQILTASWRFLTPVMSCITLDFQRFFFWGKTLQIPLTPNRQLPSLHYKRLFVSWCWKKCNYLWKSPKCPLNWRSIQAVWRWNLNIPFKTLVIWPVTSYRGSIWYTCSVPTLFE